MNLTNLMLLARSYVRAAKINVVPNATLTLILNEGASEIASEILCLPTNDTFDVEADTSEYSLSNDVDSKFIAIAASGLWWNQGTGSSPNWKRLKPRTLAWLDDHIPTWRDYASGSPEYYYQEGDALGIVPAPNTDLTDGFKLYYGEKPPTMSSGSEFPFGGSTEIARLSILSDVILAFWEWKVAKILKLSENVIVVKENIYRQELEIKGNLLKRRLDIQADRKAKFGGKYVR